jgi:hypothetical protein
VNKDLTFFFNFRNFELRAAHLDFPSFCFKLGVLDIYVKFMLPTLNCYVEFRN